MAPARMVRTDPSKAAAPEGVELGTTVAGGADWAAVARLAQTTELDPTAARVASTKMALTTFRSRLLDSTGRAFPGAAANALVGAISAIPYYCPVPAASPPADKGLVTFTSDEDIELLILRQEVAVPPPTGEVRATHGARVLQRLGPP